MKTKKPIVTYKGFDKDFKCRDKQYEENTDYEHEGKVQKCNSGFHSCENPLDVFPYYPPASSRYAESEASGEVDKDTEDTKIASSNLKIKAEINLHQMIEAGIEFIFSKVKKRVRKLMQVKGEPPQIQVIGERPKIQVIGEPPQIQVIVEPPQIQVIMELPLLLELIPKQKQKERTLLPVLWEHKMKQRHH